MLLTPSVNPIVKCLGSHLLARLALVLAAYCSIVILDQPNTTHNNRRAEHRLSGNGLPSERNGEENLGVEEEFSCGGGPFSYLMASLVSIPCDRHQIHLCCADHDYCYDLKSLNQTYCDQVFCDCLERIPSSLYCGTLAQPGLCAATHVFGHLFHPNSQMAVELRNDSEIGKPQNSFSVDNAIRS